MCIYIYIYQRYCWSVGNAVFQLSEHGLVPPPRRTYVYVYIRMYTYIYTSLSLYVYIYIYIHIYI